MKVSFFTMPGMEVPFARSAVDRLLTPSWNRTGQVRGVADRSACQLSIYVISIESE
ncbi:hypothetical protein GFS60_06664 (plasmid) [Rhodococcus sp. WAY2]|nr:hypothetical protein GFS60_06664 [Rhodococcus sp. WAY2]